MDGGLKEFKEFREFREGLRAFRRLSGSLISLISLNSLISLTSLISLISPPTHLHTLICCQSGANLPPIKRKSGWDILEVFPIRSLD